MAILQSSSIILLLTSLYASAAAQGLQERLDNNDQTGVRKGLPEIFKRPLPVRQGVQPVQTTTPIVTPPCCKPTVGTSAAPQTASQSPQTVTSATTQPTASSTTTSSSQTASTRAMTTASYQNNTSSDTFNWGNGNAGTAMNATTQYIQYGSTYGSDQNGGSSYGSNQNYANSGMSQNYGNNYGPNQNSGNSYGSNQGYGNGRRKVDFWTVMTENDIDDSNMFNFNF